MEFNSKEDVYLDWIKKWRKWRHAWTESDDVVVEFCIQIIPMDGKYSLNDHAELCHQINTTIGRSRISKDGVMEIRHSTTEESRLRILHKSTIVVFALDMFKRKDIIVLVKTIECIGHSVIHNGGIISNSFDTGSMKYIMPHIDDPIWNV